MFREVSSCNLGNEIPIETNLIKLRNLKPSPTAPDQVSRMAKDPAVIKPPMMDIPVTEGKKQPTQS